MKKMVFALLALLSMILIIGVVGGLERETIPFLTAMKELPVLLAVCGFSSWKAGAFR